MDYNSTPINAILAAGTINTIIDVTVTKDNISEQSEMFMLKLNISSSLIDVDVLENASIAICTIIDDTSKFLMMNIYEFILCVHSIRYYCQL